MRDGFGGAFADLAVIEIDAGHARLRGEGDEFRLVGREVAAAEVVFFFGQHDDRAALGSFVGQRRKLCGVGHFGFGDSGGRYKFGGLAIAESDGAGLVEQQRVHVSGGFDRPTGHGEHIVLHQAVHAGDANRRQQAANRGGNQADQQRDQHEHGLRRSGIDCKRLQRYHGQQENDGQTGQQNIQSDFVGSLLPRGAFHQRDHAVEKRLAGVGRDFYFDEVTQNTRTAGNSRAIAAGLANHRGRLSGDGRFVDRCHTLDDFSIAGDKFSGGNGNHVAGAQLGAGNFFDLPVAIDAAGNGF